MAATQILMGMVRLAYNLLWVLALPFLALSPRLRQGWMQRCGWSLPRHCDIWIQGASAGECALIATLLDHPHLKHPQHDAPLRILATTCTAQGLGLLHTTRPDISLVSRYLPFDMPLLMRWAIRRVAPKVMVLVETELWPGLLMACARCAVPVVIINARMSTTSLARYLALGPLLRTVAPAQIAAIAARDAARFGLVFGSTPVQVSGNMKFDRAAHSMETSGANPLHSLVPEQVPFIVLGSVRQEEEDLVLALMRQVRALCPSCVLGLFPRHMDRCAPWASRLAALGWTVRCSSAQKTSVRPGDILLGDRFGELGFAYALAHRAFVGGSLANLGGQNFLEPLGYGVQPVVGPYTGNFAWVGQDIFASLVVRSADVQDMARILTSPAPARDQILGQTQDYLRHRQGATPTHCALLMRFLTEDSRA
ncbi:lipid IV(A) 3-deoxy-D-manno-octulosonic acid transferase [Desulfovibrionales bacterium]